MICVERPLGDVDWVCINKGEKKKERSGRHLLNLYIRTKNAVNIYTYG